ncbi:UNVERIFIED_CONTAM: sepp1b [Trichonephila clavipes]
MGLESLQKHFRTYGMNDLEFIIVNSNLPHSQMVLHELTNRVTFDVYQDTIEKNIWGLMEGGKDDIYVYDRCGRLAYYIPYPLSIMNSEEALVVSAILATYYRSPCGTTCDKNNNSSLEAILNAKETTDEGFIATTENYSDRSNFSNELSTISSQPQDSDMVNVYETTLQPEQSLSIKNDLLQIEDFDYLFFNDTNLDYDSNDTDIVLTNELYNSLFGLFFQNETLNNTTEDLNISLNTTDSSVDELTNNSSNDIITIINSYQHHEFNRTDITSQPNPKLIHTVTESQQNQVLNHSVVDIHQPEDSTELKITTRSPKRKSDRCIEADISVCKNWSKKKLIRAHGCCSSLDPKDVRQQSQSCRNFGKKRCKKLKPILKCCIKTAFLETTVIDESEEFLNTEKAVVKDHFDVSTVPTNPTEENSYDVICCKNQEKGRLCRVIQTSPCDVGEYIAENVDPSEVTNSEM